MLNLADQILSPRTKYGIFVLFCLVTLLYFNNKVVGYLISGLWGVYILPSFLWIVMAVIVYFCLPDARPFCKIRHLRSIRWAGFLFGIVTVAALLIAGIMDEFGRSPYNHSLFGILTNLFYLGSMLLGIELVRSWLINYLFKKWLLLGVGLISLFFSLFFFSLSQLSSFSSAVDGAQFAGNVFFPIFVENVLATYLAFLGGPLPVIIYRGILLSFQWFSPVLPNLNWLMQVLVEVFVPVFCIILLYQFHIYEIKGVRKKPREKESPLFWLTASVVSVVVIWFSLGLFSFFPNVIVTGSMVPYIEVGDIVIVKEFDAKGIEKGDVIQFKREQLRINHRVIEVQLNEKGEKLFITKGDANEHPDKDPVKEDQLVGKVIQVIPKVGWLTIWIRSSI